MCFWSPAVLVCTQGSEVNVITGEERGQAVISCPYDQGYETYPKVLSKGRYRWRTEVVHSKSHQTDSGRYGLHDNTETRVFTVTITNLTEEDSGKYWCEVATWGPNLVTEVLLTVGRCERFLHNQYVMRKSKRRK